MLRVIIFSGDENCTHAEVCGEGGCLLRELNTLLYVGGVGGARHGGGRIGCWVGRRGVGSLGICPIFLDNVAIPEKH